MSFKNYSVEAEYYKINDHRFSIAEKWNMVANRVSLYGSVELGLGFRSCFYYLTRQTCPECQFIIHAASASSAVKWEIAIVQFIAYCEH